MANTTFVSELNRLANGGATYPSLAVYREEAGAANAWAGTTGLTLIGALHAKAGVTDVSLFRELDGICNQLAGTTGLTAVDALSRVPS